VRRCRKFGSPLSLQSLSQCTVDLDESGTDLALLSALIVSTELTVLWTLLTEVLEMSPALFW